MLFDGLSLIPNTYGGWLFEVNVSCLVSYDFVFNALCLCVFEVPHAQGLDSLLVGSFISVLGWMLKCNNGQPLGNAFREFIITDGN